MTILSFVIMVVSFLVGMSLLIIGLPGNWVLMTGMFLAIGVNPTVEITVATVIIFFSLCILGEVLEWGLILFGAKRYGVTKAGTLGGIVGGVLGAIGFSPLFPVIGTLAGGILGVVVGVLSVELARGKSRKEALKMGWGIFLTWLMSVATKIGIGFTIGVYGLFLLL